MIRELLLRSTGRSVGPTSRPAARLSGYLSLRRRFRHCLVRCSSEPHVTFCMSKRDTEQRIKRYTNPPPPPHRKKSHQIAVIAVPYTKSYHSGGLLSQSTG